MSYIVTADHPFYPEVHYVKNQSEAEAVKKRSLILCPRNTESTTV